MSLSAKMEKNQTPQHIYKLTFFFMREKTGQVVESISFLFGFSGFGSWLQVVDDKTLLSG